MTRSDFFTFYQCLSPEMKSLLIEQAKLLLKFDSPQDRFIDER